MDILESNNNDENSIILNDDTLTNNQSFNEEDDDFFEDEIILQELQEITPIAFPTCVRYGPNKTVDFKVIGPQGVGIYEGVISNWPLWKFKTINKKLMSSIYYKAINSEVTSDDFQNTDIYCLMIKFEVYNYDLNRIVLENHHKMLSDKKKSFFYVLADFQKEPQIFKEKQEMYDSFISDYPVEFEWDEVDDYYEVLEEYKQNKGKWILNSETFYNFEKYFNKFL